MERRVSSPSSAETIRANYERLKEELGLAESPRVGEILAEVRRRKLNGELDGRDSELAAARELIGT